MATGTSTPPVLKLKRSSQSGQKLMSSSYASVYTEENTSAFFFAGAQIDLTGMTAADAIDIQLYARMSENGSLVLLDTISYTGARPAGRKVVTIGCLPNIYGVDIKMRQTSGTLLTIPCEFYDAKRIGVV